MNNQDKINRIDEVLAQCEDILHGRAGEEVTEARKLLSQLATNGGSADVSDSWLSPIESERKWQENGIKKIWAGYPNCSFRWQYLNGLIRMTCEYLKIDVDKP